jgi:hypothetical protein
MAGLPIVCVMLGILKATDQLKRIDPAGNSSLLSTSVYPQGIIMHALYALHVLQWGASQDIPSSASGRVDAQVFSVSTHDYQGNSSWLLCARWPDFFPLYSLHSTPYQLVFNVVFMFTLYIIMQYCILSKGQHCNILHRSCQ